jgi:hypothetical protein
MKIKELRMGDSVEMGLDMDRESIRHTKSDALRPGFCKQVAAPLAQDHVRLGTIKPPREREQSIDLDRDMVRFLRDGACKRSSDDSHTASAVFTC